MSNNFLGTTITYVAPEIVNGSPMNEKSDIYSLGMTIYETISNVTSPWEGCFSILSDLTIKDALLKGSRPKVDIENIYEENTSRVSSVIKDCWNQDPSLRPSILQVRIFIGMYQASLLR